MIKNDNNDDIEKLKVRVENLEKQIDRITAHLDSEVSLRLKAMLDDLQNSIEKEK